MKTIDTKLAAKLSVRFEDGRSATSRRIIEAKLNRREEYDLYVERPNDLRVVVSMRNFSIYVENEENVEQVNNAMTYLMSKLGRNKKRGTLLDESICAVIWYLTGLKVRGVNTRVHTAGTDFFIDGEENTASFVAYSSTDSENELSENYNYRSLESYVYELLALNQGTISDLRIGLFNACYASRKYFKRFFPEALSILHEAGRDVEYYDVPDFGLPVPTVHNEVTRSRISSGFRELLDDSFDYDLLDELAESAANFYTEDGTHLTGSFFYDYRGRMYFAPKGHKLNPQGDTELREHLFVDGKHVKELDATCSGIQLGSLISGNEKMMKMTNVIDVDGTKQDAYQYVADIAMENLNKEYAAEGHELLTHIDRKVAKKTVMLLPYGAANRTLLNHAVNSAEEMGMDNPKRVGRAIYDAVEQEVARDATYNRVLEIADIKVFSKDGIDYGEYASWKTMDGFNVNSYSKVPADKINQLLEEGQPMLHTYNHSKLSLDLIPNDTMDIYHMDGVNIKFYKNSKPNVGQITPNFIHSCDATALRYVIRKLMAENIHVFVIHDCVMVSEDVPDSHIQGLFREAYQAIADYYNVDVKITGNIVYPE